MKRFILDMIRRYLSVFLSIVLLLSAWVFVAPDSLPKADAYSSDGTGFAITTSRSGFSGSHYSITSVSTSPSGTQNSFPSSVSVTVGYSFDNGDSSVGGTNRSFSGTINLYLNGVFAGSCSVSASEKMYAWGDGTKTGTKSGTINSTARSISSIVLEGTESLSVSYTDTAAKTASYTAYAKDQYGVLYKTDISFSNSDGYDGTRTAGSKNDSYSMLIGNGTSTQYPKDNSVTVTASAGGKSATRTLSITPTYRVTFYNEDQQSSLGSSTLSYNGSATAPTMVNYGGTGGTSKASDDTNHYTFGGWTGDTYQNVTSGPLDRKTYASWTGAAHAGHISARQHDDTQHWFYCTVCGKFTNQAGTELQPKEDHNWSTEFDSNNENEHWETCTICGHEKPNTRAGHTAPVQTYDAQDHWSICTDCGKILVGKVAHTWDYEHATFNWQSNNRRCTTATVNCKYCAGTKIFDTTCNEEGVVTAPATCDTNGNLRITASFTGDDGQTYSDFKDHTITKKGHLYTGDYHALGLVEGVYKHNRACTQTWEFNGATHTCGTYGLDGEKDKAEACTPQSDYSKDASQHWKVCNLCDQDVTAKADHVWDYAHAVYNWNEYECATATVSCSVCKQTKTENTTVTSVTVDPVCEEDGSTVYTAAFTVDDTTYTDKKTKVLGKINHNWGTPIYTWAEDFSTVTAQRVCLNDANHKETETVSATSVVTETPTCTEEGTRHYYTNTPFKNTAFSAQERNETEPINPDNHDFSRETKDPAYLKTAATCEGDAVYYKSCSRCGKSTNDKEIYGGGTFVHTNSRLGHDFTNTDASNVVNAGNGVHYYKCSRYEACGACGVVVNDVSEKNETVPCSSTGTNVADCSKKAKCDVCGELYGELGSDNHAFTVQNENSNYRRSVATCENDATYYYKCSRCAKSTNDNKANGEGTYGGDFWTKANSALGHKYVGDYHYLGSVDGDFKHNRACTTIWIENGETKSCGTYGLVVNGEQKKDAAEACTPEDSFSEGDENQHWKNCSLCGRVASEKVNHNWDYENAVFHWNVYECPDATVSCADCFRDKSIETTVTPSTTAATCTENGSTVYTAAFTADGTTYTAQKTQTHVKIGHAWGEPTYEWNSDKTQVTAKRVCGNDANHVETETVNVTATTTAATCVATGLTVYTGAAFKNKAFTAQGATEVLAIDPTNHDGHLAYVAIVKATCTAPGKRAHYYCSACEKEYSDAAGTVLATNLEIPAHEHSYDEGVVILRATCTAKGTRRFTCLHTEETDEYEACAYSYEADIDIDSTNHDGNLAYVAIVKASCTDDGVAAHYYCSACKTKFTDDAGTHETTNEALVIEKRSHVWNAGEITKTPTCAETGIKLYTCTLTETDTHLACTDTYEEVLSKDANNHTGVLDPEHQTELRNFVQATCFENGEGYSGDLYCLGCGTELEHGHVVQRQPHTYTGENINAENAWKSGANCVSPAIYVKCCRYCNAVDEDRNNTFTYGEIAPEVHAGTMNPTAYLAPTCVAEGHVAYYTCTACNNNYSDDSGLTAKKLENVVIAINPENHPAALTPTAYKAPTCVAEGNEAYYTCGSCHNNYSAATGLLGEKMENVVIAVDPQNHPAALTPTAYKAATCVAEGNEAYYTCGSCHNNYAAATGLLAEKMENVVIAIDPENHPIALVKTDFKQETCLAPGNEAYYTCAACNNIYSSAEGRKSQKETLADTVRAQLDHDYSGLAVKVDETTHQCRCINGCNQLGAAVQHAWNDGTTIEPTCTTAGKTDYCCTANGCDAAKTENHPALGHAYKKASYHWAADYSSVTGELVCANDVKGDGVVDHTITETVVEITKRISVKPTCQTAGKYVYTAQFTNQPDHSAWTDLMFTEQNTVELLTKGDHTLVKTEATPPTCSVDGNTEFWTCTSCRHYFADENGTTEITYAQTAILRIAHDFTGLAQANVNGTHSYACIYGCGAVGNTKSHVFNIKNDADKYIATYSDCVNPATYYYSCECGAKGTATFEGVPLGHTLVPKPSEEPTCTKEGCSAYQQCTRCQAVVNQVKIPALGHGAYLYDRAASGELYDGSLAWNTYSCSRGCGDSYTEFTVRVKDTGGKAVPGAVVTIIADDGTEGKAITGTDGTCVVDQRFNSGEFTVDVTYTSGNATASTSGSVRVTEEGRGSGGVGKLDTSTLYNQQPTTTEQPVTQPTTNSNPSGGDQSSNNNSSSGEENLSFFQRIIRWFQSLFSGIFG